jgi:hypothetical protein
MREEERKGKKKKEKRFLSFCTHAAQHSTGTSKTASNSETEKNPPRAPKKLNHGCVRTVERFNQSFSA